ncbi:hypothetical protein CEXT_292041 [Caerostris extrusa]|uniref:Uncharacterized protein n=1 Tax=Caerostris extrusa TaxID=172846 RepID=A0AAV4TNI9_CAEEX|nr:hypothetical protein CEXT_292041 [Caerostris extrusa]
MVKVSIGEDMYIGSFSMKNDECEKYVAFLTPAVFLISIMSCHSNGDLSFFKRHEYCAILEYIFSCIQQKPRNTAKYGYRVSPGYILPGHHNLVKITSTMAVIDEGEKLYFKYR